MLIQFINLHSSPPKRKSTMKNRKILVALILAGMTAMATAETNNPPNGENGPSEGQGGHEGRRGPPPQAILLN